MIEYLTAKADWLSISYPTSMSPHSELLAIYNQVDPLILTEMGGNKQLYKSFCGGSIFITSKENYINISISGGMLTTARERGLFNELLQVLSSAPYNITRLDIAYDVPISGSKSISRIQALYPLGHAVLANRARQLQYVTNQINATEQTGTVYFQNSKYKGTIKLKVYDKAHELYQSHNQVIPPTTRYELTIARGASLRDFSHPDVAFWHFLPVDLLKRPETVSQTQWKATERINYDDYQTQGITDYQRFKFIVENHPALIQLIQEAKAVNGGDSLLRRQIENLLLQDVERHVASEVSVTGVLN
jgi:hypothetical protein